MLGKTAQLSGLSLNGFKIIWSGGSCKRPPWIGVKHRGQAAQHDPKWRLLYGNSVRIGWKFKAWKESESRCHPMVPLRAFVYASRSFVCFFKVECHTPDGMNGKLCMNWRWTNIEWVSQSTSAMSCKCLPKPTRFQFLHFSRVNRDTLHWSNDVLTTQITVFWKLFFSFSDHAFFTFHYACWP